jgi:hypothetical protein
VGLNQTFCVEKMRNLLEQPDKFVLAYKLAYFVHRDKSKAISIVTRAINKLEVAATVQFKRLYYTPSKRSISNQSPTESHRTKISLSELHLLQRQIYIESEAHEKEQEEQRPETLTEEDLLIRFIKHLVRISIKRNSFYVTLGISRLLHSYTTAETMEIYNVVVQDPERVKDDYYYRSRKGRLIQEIKERFGNLIKVARGARGEERFEARDCTDECARVAQECLDYFAPWKTSCYIPDKFNPVADELPPLTLAGHDEDKIEINRIHAVIHPDCYARLADALKLERPAQRLHIPSFFLPKDQNKMNRPDNGSRRSIPGLSVDELEAIKNQIGEQAARRKTTHAGLLTIVVDGSARARLDLNRTGSVKFEVAETDELIEVRALNQDQETLLATYLMSGDEMDEPSAPVTSEIILEGGQKLSFNIASTNASNQNQPASTATTLMTVAYRETDFRRAAALALRRKRFQLSEALISESFPARAWIKPALASLFVILCVGILALFVLNNHRQRRTTEIAATRQQPSVPVKEQSVPLPSPGVDVIAKGAVDSNSFPQIFKRKLETGVHQQERSREHESSSPRLSTKSAPIVQPRILTEESQPQRKAALPDESANIAVRSSTERDATRTLNPTQAAASLSKVRKIYVEVNGDSRFGQAFSEMLLKNFQSNQRLGLTNDKDEADAMLKISFTETAPVKSGNTENSAGVPSSQAAARPMPGTNATLIIARLVNEDGEVIWPAAKDKKSGLRYNGTTVQVAKKIANDLLIEIRRSEKQKPR